MSHKMGSYDEIPDGMKRYINNYGCHFNRKLCEEAVDRMYTTSADGKKERRKTDYSKEKVEQLLRDNGIQLENNGMYDHVYVANMCAYDFLGRSVPDERHLAIFIKDMIDDPDAEPGYIFNRWYADTVFMNEPVEWEDML